MQSAFFVNTLALVEGQPKVLSLKEVLQSYVDFRHVVITRRSKFELKVAKERAHILEGLKIALDNLDAVINTIRKSDTAETARQRLMANFNLTQIQAQAILDMQLRRLASLERQKILDEYEQLLKTINYLEELLANPKRIYLLIKDDVNDLKAKYGDLRRTQIVAEEATEFREEDLIPHQRVVVTLSARGYVKSVPARAFTPQHRGGKGIIGMVTREADAVKLLAVADTHDSLLFFTNRGKVYSLKCHELPVDTSRISKGTAIINLFPIAEGERITAMVPVADFAEKTFILMATANGEIKKTAVMNFASVRSSGLIATDLPEGDELVATCLATDKNEIVLVTKQGKSIRFNVSSLRASSRTSGGVRAIRLTKGDHVVSMDRVIKGAYLLVATAFGFGKLTPLDRYPKQHRAGGGVLTFHVVDKTGEVVAARVVTDKDLVMIISAEGIVTCTPTWEKDPRQGITIQGRATQGVRLMRLGAGDRIVALTAFSSEEEKE
jgi:DNA gyrase subunit A